MNRKLLSLFFVIGLLLSLSSKGFSHDILCVHVHGGVSHLETEHAQVPISGDEIHFKLITDITSKVFKISTDAPAERFQSLIPVGFWLRVYRKVPQTSRKNLTSFNPVEKIRLII